MTRSSAFIAFVVLLLAACSSLRVEVDVADPNSLEVWNSKRLLADGGARVAVEPIGAIRDRVHAMKMSKLQAYLASRSTDYASLTGNERQKAIDQLEVDFGETVGAFYDYHADVLETLGTKIREEQRDAESCDAEFRAHAARVAEAKANRKKNAGRGGSSTANQSGGGSQNTNSSRVPAPPTCVRSRGNLVALLQQREKLFADVERGPDFVLSEGTGPLTSLVGQDGLFREPEAFTVASAPENLWHQNFDRSFSWSLFGDTNVAIKMESRGNFSIKGVSFDPSEVTRVASKVVTQSLLAWTQIAGVPATAAARQPGSIPVVMAENDRDRLLFDSDRVDQSRALLAVADAIGGAKARLADEALRPNATQALIAIWQANRDRILHDEGPAVPSRLTLAPLQASVAPGEKFTLFPAIASKVDRGTDVALTVNEDVIVDFPKFAVIPAGQEIGQLLAEVRGNAAWKDYAITATLAQEQEQMTIHVAPKFDLQVIPAKILTGSEHQIALAITSDQPANSQTPKPEVSGSVGAKDDKFENKALTFTLVGATEGSGTLTIATGNAKSEPKTISVVKPVVTVANQAVVKGETIDVNIAADRKGGVGVFKTDITAEGSGVDIDGASPDAWPNDRTSLPIRITGLVVGTHPVRVKPPAGEKITFDEVTFTVAVTAPSVEATPAVIQGIAGTSVEIRLKSVNLSEASSVALSVDAPTIAEVADEATLPAAGEEVVITVDLQREGEAVLIVENNADISPLRIPIKVTAAPPEQ